MALKQAETYISFIAIVIILALLVPCYFIAWILRSVSAAFDAS